uniref:Putative HET domain-containing protein n=1 Tax=Cladonia uncialis subsp. uncialis TaxID=180999 RepID=A0A2K9YEE6_CLAUC|nr:putative HET domain-containing protein [Cladonia uncialis subsp. uncialis]
MSESEQTTFNRIQAILHNDRFIPNPLFRDRYPPPFHSKGFRYVRQVGGADIDRTEEDEVAYIETICTGLYSQIDESPSYMVQLDRKFAELLECRFQLTGTGSPFRELRSPELECKVTERILHLLSRLPETPLELPGLPSGLPLVYFTQRTAWEDPHAPRWEDLKVAVHLSINVIRPRFYTLLL